MADYEKLAGGVVKAAQDFIKRSLAPIVENVGGLIQRADKQGAKLDSIERRASRHADHLQRLEDRVKRLEGK